ncbi:MAG: hypothetical protein ACRDID_21400 [Ktedonobacterales bacterium]
MQWNDEQARFIVEHTQPQPPDIEVAKRIIVAYLADLPPLKAESSAMLVTQVRMQLARDPGPIPPGWSSIVPALNVVRAEFAAREALQLLHASGALIAHGPLSARVEREEQQFSVQNPTSSGPSNVVLSVPAVYGFYQLATGFRGAHARLADPDVYLSHIDLSQLPARARMCIREAINAFRHGLYLSATLNLGTASENLWLQLARAVAAKTPTNDLQRELAKPYQAIARIIELTWTALQSHLKKGVLDDIVIPPDQPMFKQHADRLRYLRNYAAHADAADDEEPRFTYAETGLLLLDAAEYINQLTRLYACVEAIP